MECSLRWVRCEEEDEVDDDDDDEEEDVDEFAVVSVRARAADLLETSARSVVVPFCAAFDDEEFCSSFFLFLCVSCEARRVRRSFIWKMLMWKRSVRYASIGCCV